RAAIATGPEGSSVPEPEREPPPTSPPPRRVCRARIRAMRETADPVRIELVGRTSPATRDDWEEVLRADPLALETQSPAWTDAMCASGGFEDASRLYVDRGGRKVVLPMLRRSLPGRAVAVEGSHPPHCGVGGVL